jgi:hypothetical protein
MISTPPLPAQCLCTPIAVPSDACGGTAIAAPAPRGGLFDGVRMSVSLSPQHNTSRGGDTMAAASMARVISELPDGPVEMEGEEGLGAPRRGFS